MYETKNASVIPKRSQEHFCPCRYEELASEMKPAALSEIYQKMKKLGETHMTGGMNFILTETNPFRFLKIYLTRN